MEVNIAGMDALLQNLRQLNVDESLENKALNKAGKVTQEAILAEANFGSRSRGTIKENIKLRRAKNGEAVIHTSKGYHAHIIEGGRSGGSMLVNGRKVTWGPIAPNPFFSRGFETSVENAKQEMIEELQRGLGL